MSAQQHRLYWRRTLARPCPDILVWADAGHWQNSGDRWGEIEWSRRRRRSRKRRRRRRRRRRMRGGWFLTWRWHWWWCWWQLGRMTAALFQTTERERLKRERSLFFSSPMFSFFLSCYVSLSFLFLSVFFFICFPLFFLSFVFNLCFSPFLFFLIFFVFFFLFLSKCCSLSFFFFFSLGPPLVFIRGVARQNPRGIGLGDFFHISFALIGSLESPPSI